MWNAASATATPPYASRHTAHQPIDHYHEWQRSNGDQPHHMGEGEHTGQSPLAYPEPYYLTAHGPMPACHHEATLGTTQHRLTYTDYPWSGRYS